MLSCALMPPRALTRRTLLIGVLGTGAASLSRRASALADLSGPPRVRFEQRTLGLLAAGITRVDLARNADLFGLEWHAPQAIGERPARVEVSFRDARGRWGPWLPAGPGAHGPDGAERARARERVALGAGVLGEPVWSGGTRAIAVRSDRALASVRLYLLDVSDGVAFIHMGGGCQGCGMAEVTLGQGVRVAILERFPEIIEVRDTTDHAQGANPYYQAAKK